MSKKEKQDKDSQELEILEKMLEQKRNYMKNMEEVLGKEINDLADKIQIKRLRSSFPPPTV